MKRFSFALATVGMLAAAVCAAGKVESGLKAGARMPLFDVVDVSGPDKGKQLCLV